MQKIGSVVVPCLARTYVEPNRILNYPIIGGGVLDIVRSLKNTAEARPTVVPQKN